MRFARRRVNTDIGNIILLSFSPWFMITNFCSRLFGRQRYIGGGVNEQGGTDNDKQIAIFRVRELPASAYPAAGGCSKQKHPAFKIP